MSMLDRDGDFNFALLTAAPGLLGVAVAVAALINGRGPAPEWLLLLPIAIAYCGATAWFVTEQREEDRFRTWLLASIAAIQRGEPARYGDVAINLDTRLQVFAVPVSMIALSYVVQLRPRLLGHEPVGSLKISSAALSLVIGLWSFWGIFRGPAYLWTNARGGRVLTVAEYYAELPRK